MANMKIDIDAILKTLKLDKNKKETLLLAAAVFFVLIGAYLFTFVKPKVVELITLFKDMRVMKSDITRVQNALAREGMLKKKLLSMQEKVTLYEKKLPTEHEVPMLLEELSKMAKETYVKILGISPVYVKIGSVDEKPKPYKEIPISIHALSGYHQLGAFINKLENAGRFMKVSDIQIRTSNKNKRAHDVELVVSTYVLLKEEE